MGNARFSWLTRIAWIFSALVTLLIVLIVFGGKTIEETLTQPRAVARVTNAALILEDGRHVPIPGITGLPAQSPALAALLVRGVEVDRDERVVGLAEIHHWCSHDPVRRHIARIDIGNALLWLGHGPVPTTLESFRDLAASDAFSERGWNYSDYGLFLQFEHDLVNSQARAPARRPL